MKFSIAFIIFLTTLCCKEIQIKAFDPCTFYNLNEPNKVWRLPKALNEISGISLSSQEEIICINDEQGKLFVYDLKNKTITKKIPFAKKGDYEDVAIKGNTAFVLRSDGTIFEVSNYKGTLTTIKHKTFLTKKDDAEGLFFDEDKNRLLIACKGNSNNKKDNYTRLVHEFLLKDNHLNSNPVLTISQNEINKTYNLKNIIAPSGIAIHPISKNIFILSSVNKILAEYTQGGKLQKIYSLDYSHFEQPEGISFDKNGDLYISNEAKKNKSNILKFNYSHQ